MLPPSLTNSLPPTPSSPTPSARVQAPKIAKHSAKGLKAKSQHAKSWGKRSPHYLRYQPCWYNNLERGKRKRLTERERKRGMKVSSAGERQVHPVITYCIMELINTKHLIFFDLCIFLENVSYSVCNTVQSLKTNSDVWSGFHTNALFQVYSFFTCSNTGQESNRKLTVTYICSPCLQYKAEWHEETALI